MQRTRARAASCQTKTVYSLLLAFWTTHSHFQSTQTMWRIRARAASCQDSTECALLLAFWLTMVTIITMGGDLQPGCLARQLLTGLGQPLDFILLIFIPLKQCRGQEQELQAVGPWPCFSCCQLGGEQDWGRQSMRARLLCKIRLLCVAV